MDKRVLKIKTVDDMLKILKTKGRPFASFKKGDTIKVWNKMAEYSYVLSESPGTAFAEGFQPYVTPEEMLCLGVFGGKYMNDCLLEFPAEWFLNAALLGKLCPEGNNPSINYFQIHSRLPLTYWKDSGWLPGGKVLDGKREVLSLRNPDERGWFQWYCRYWMGRRIPDLDSVQIQRWKNFARHYGAVKKHCVKGDLSCRPRQRQALLQWAWKFDS